VRWLILGETCPSCL